MGERTQLFINVTDENNEKLLGTVIHYQWGIETRMLLDALHIATNLPMWLYDVTNEQEKEKYRDLDYVLTNCVGLHNPKKARLLRSEIFKLVDGNHEVMNISETNDTFVDYLNKLLINYPENQRQKLLLEPRIGNDIECLEYEILDAYNATYKDFKDQCDNNDGFMIMDVEYNNQSDLDKDSFGSQNNLEKIRFGFILSDYGNPTKPVTLEEYAKLPINNLSDKFINSYKGLLQSLDIGFLSIDEVKSKLEL
ncbi:hypothetical protein [Lactobacillus crispatus]|uniref:Uncharacterized protein n=1 Tax=Lactobacillus crispatus TaxID=47770 RepID=A0AB73BMQ7_9LACO|nr:hypothetical protein [Lactobacillus crispatus]KAA8780249.1 hypothetical protein F1C01_10310 [Lactobacillus crispatus]KAA8792152.1 hypothetical protein F1C00_10605 [Lactobacillus crispatus]KAA8796213.1 hypothetical protein F1C02_10330 [Lactobacillus crispatus]KAA8799837.1 hypothetical protein F1C03_10380 [Lactobacillus crispatus]KAA8801425.1 hypothetical protein F1C04_09775 [Lactobacillus crispatus]